MAKTNTTNNTDTTGTTPQAPAQEETQARSLEAAGLAVIVGV